MRKKTLHIKRVNHKLQEKDKNKTEKVVMKLIKQSQNKKFHNQKQSLAI